MAGRILLIDDNQDAVELLQLALQHDGYEVQVALGGRQGLDLAEKFSPDVIFCDLGMPGMLGYEVAETLRRSPVLSNTYLVALTGWNDTVTRQKVVAAGFDRHLAKPANIRHLKCMLDEFFDDPPQPGQRYPGLSARRKPPP